MACSAAPGGTSVYAQTSVPGTFKTIAIDGSFGDWTGVPLAYTAPAGSTNAIPTISTADVSGTAGSADYRAVYAFNDMDNYYFRVTFGQDIPGDAGQVPLYVDIFYDTDNDVGTGYLPGTVGSELLTESGFGFQEAAGHFSDLGGINGLNWSCLPATTYSDFEFSISRSATYASDNLPVFTTNVLNVHFSSRTALWGAGNEAPPGGVMSYTNMNISVPPLPVSRLAASAVPGNRVAVVGEGTGTLQAKGSLSGGTWTNVPATTSPYVAPASQSSLFFRLTQ